MAEHRRGAVAAEAPPLDPPTLGRRLTPHETATELGLADRQRADQRGAYGVAAGLDVANAPAIDDLVAAEESVRRRLSPKRMLGRGQGWTELAAVDERIAELDERRQELEARTAVLRSELADVDRQDAERVAVWIENGRQGAKPTPNREAVELDLHEAEIELGGIARAIEHAEQEREHVVERHRGQMVADAHRLVQTRLRGALDLVDELRRARDVLHEAVDLCRWAQRYPTAIPAPPYATLALDAKSVHELIGAMASVPVAKIIDALTADVQALAGAAGNVPSGDERARAAAGARWASEPVPQTERQRITDAVLDLARREYGVAHPAEAQVDAICRALDGGEIGPDPR
jgi:hypothetical protein